MTILDELRDALPTGWGIERSKGSYAISLTGLSESETRQIGTILRNFDSLLVACEAAIDGWSAMDIPTRNRLLVGLCEAVNKARGRK